MSDTNRVGFRISKEVTPGTTVATNALVALPFTGASDLGFTPETATSAIIRDDRQVSDLVLVNGTTGGGFDTELIAGDALDALLEGVMFSADWTAEVVSAASGELTTSDGAGTTSLVSDASDFSGISVGDLLEITIDGVTTLAATIAASASTIVVVGALGSGVTSTGSWGVTALPQVKNGTTQRSYTMERTFDTGGTPFYEYLRGMVPGTFSVSASASSIVESSFGFIGQSQSFESLFPLTGFSGDDARPAAPTFSVYNAASNVATLAIGGEVQTDNFVMEASIEVENNLRERNALGTLGATSIGAGEFSVTGSLNTYFSDSSLAQAVIDNDETSLTLGFKSGDEEIVFYMPRVKFSEGLADVSGANADVMLNLSFQAIADSDMGYTMAIAKVQA